MTWSRTARQNGFMRLLKKYQKAVWQPMEKWQRWQEIQECQGLWEMRFIRILEPEHIPCYRVVNSKGELAGAFAFGGENVQKKLLEADGIEVINGKVDLKKYGL